MQIMKLSNRDGTTAVGKIIFCQYLQSKLEQVFMQYYAKPYNSQLGNTLHQQHLHGYNFLN